MDPAISVEPHPLLEAVGFVAIFPKPLGDLTTPPGWRALLSPLAVAPWKPTEEVQKAIRDLLRWGGYKPTGRGKPASEYLIRAATDGALGSINPAVDACNVVSLHTGLPISVIDSDLGGPPWGIRVAADGSEYVFNPGGQSIRLGGLLCLHDAEGPCANPVRDSQRTKTHPATRRTLTVIWGSRNLPGRATEAATWYRSLLAEVGASTGLVPLTGNTTAS